MKIRTQLVLACFVLSVLPLSGIVLYSYHSSRKALESAYQVEAQRLTKQMDRRLTSIRAELDERLASLSEIPIPHDQSTQEAASSAIFEEIMTAVGDAAPLIDALRFVPAPPDPSAPAAAVVAEAGPSAAPPPPGDAAEPIVIDIPPATIPRLTVPAEVHAGFGEIARLSLELERNAGAMSPGERKAKKEELRHKREMVESQMDAARERFREQVDLARQQAGERRRIRQAQRESQRTARKEAGLGAPAARTQPRSVTVRRALSSQDRERMKRKEKQGTLILGRKFNIPLQKGGEVVGQIQATLATDEVIRRVLGGASDDRDELPFAIDREGNVYTRSREERATLDALGIPQRVKNGESLRTVPDWIVVLNRDEESGLRVGVARPVGGNFVHLRKTAARNFGYGMGLIAFALIGIVPLANHFTRDVKTVTAGAERIAQGDLQTRLPVKSKDEFGQLALAFNKMAEDLSENQRRLVQSEVQQIDYERKSVELEDARRFQLSMLPKDVPSSEHFDIAVFTKTATEVGGDYYDFHTENGSLAVTIGDATGHGAKAGTMVTVIKALFAGYRPHIDPRAFLSDAATRIKRMDLGRMAMALSLARFERSRFTLSSAGMPPALVHRRASGQIEEIALPATPLGTLGTDYAEEVVALSPGDTVLLMTDGYPELQNHAGQQLGYAAAAHEFAEAAGKAGDARALVEQLAETAARWRGDGPPNDDVTFVVIRVR